MTSSSFPRLWLALLLLPGLSPLAAAQEPGVQIIRGTVRTPDREPIAGARVSFTGLRSFKHRVTETNAKGQYTILFGDPEDEYVMSVGAIGYAPLTDRARRMGTSTLLAIDVILPRSIAHLDSVTVLADRELAATDTATFGAREHSVTGKPLFSLDPSALDTLLAQAAGVATIRGLGGAPDRYSVLGASADQNSVLLDGNKFDGQTLPPGVLESATVATTTYDAARGDFAGGQLALKTRSGKDRFDGSIEGRLADPRLAWTDAGAGTTVPHAFSRNAAISGPIKPGSVYYNVGASQSTQRRDLVSLLSLNTLQREQQGLLQDTLVALQQTLADLGVPVTRSNIPDRNTARNRSALLRVDVVPSAATTLTLTGSADDARQAGDGIWPLSFPSLGSEWQSRNLRGQVSGSGYFRGFVTEFSSSYQHRMSTAGPLVASPSGSVRVGTQYPGGTVGLADLSFGGGGAARSHAVTRSWELRAELSRLTSNTRHKLTVGQSINVTWSSSRNATHPFGAFTYQTLDDLAANRPASYTRTFSGMQRSSKAVANAVWFKGESNAKPDRLQLQYGLRFDFTHTSSIPPYNPVVDSLFGRRTDQVPTATGLSPRLGFTWVVKPPRSAAPSPSAPITLSGGVGAFRGVIPTERITGLLDAVGLPTSTRQLTCVGAATPVPDWTPVGSDSSAAPMHCLDGTAPVEFAVEVPGVQLFRPSYRPPTSWRGNLKVEGIGVAGWRLILDGTYSSTLHAESAVDLNLRQTPVFALLEEAGRPVFVSPASVVPTTGAIAPGASRVTDRFGGVTDYRSDLASRAIQLSVQVNRNSLLGTRPLALTYSFTRVRQQERGFTGPTAGDPFDREWVQGPQATHEIRLQTSFEIPLVLFTVDLALASGQPYTPMIVGDANGDGLNNDRAFVFDPATTSDSVLMRQMRDLLATVTPATRTCLTSQLGRIAARNSCRTGWRFQPNMRFDLRLPGMSDPSMTRSTLAERLQLSVTTSNAMGTLLHLLGISKTSFNVLSGVNYPLDPNLVYVDGFDPGTQRFHYRVNQQFGEGHPQRIQNAKTRYSGMFQVQLGAKLKLGPIERRPPLVRELGLVAPDRMLPPPTEAEVRERLRQLTENPIATLLQLRDSLLLSTPQIQRLKQHEAAFLVRADSLLAPVAVYIAKHGERAKDKRVRKLVAKAQQDLRPLMIEMVRAAVAELQGEQRQRLPEKLRRTASSPT